MSYATTTSAGFNENGQLIKNGTATAYPPTGYRAIADADTPPSANLLFDEKNSCYRYFTGYDQTLWRTRQAVSNGCAGIFYWDMGNDLPTSSALSLARASSYAVNANVDTIITAVDNVPAAPVTSLHAVSADSRHLQATAVYDAATHAVSVTLSSGGETAGPNATATLYDAQGRALSQQPLSGGRCAFSTRGLCGTYFIGVKLADGRIVSTKVTVG